MGISHIAINGTIYGFSPYVILGSLAPDLPWLFNYAASRRRIGACIIFDYIQNLGNKQRIGQFKNVSGINKFVPCGINKFVPCGINKFVPYGIKQLLSGEWDHLIDSGIFYKIGIVFHSLGMMIALVILSYLIHRPGFTFFVYSYVLHLVLDPLFHKKSPARFCFWPFRPAGRKNGDIGLFQWNLSNTRLFFLSNTVVALIVLTKFLIIPKISDFLNIYSKYWYSLWFIIPAYVANAVPVIISKLELFNKPIDFGKAIFGKRIFGNHKTWRGFIFALFYGFIIGFLQNRAFQGLILGLGAMSGDLLASFLKRRLNIAPGEKFLLVDQLNLLAGALFLAYLFGFMNLDFSQIIFLTAFTLLIHHLSSLTGYKLKIKSKPW